MNKFRSLCLIVLLFWGAFHMVLSAQFSVSASSAFLNLTDPSDGVDGVDAVVLINGISASDEISLSAGGTTYAWTWIEAGTSYNSTESHISPSDGVTYFVSVDGGETLSVAVIDYALYPIALTGLDLLRDENECTLLMLQPRGTAEPLTYVAEDGSTKTLPRTFTIAYTDSEYLSDAWADAETEVQLHLLSSAITIVAPKKTCVFTLSGDQYAEDMGLELSSVLSEEYSAVAVEMHLTGKIEMRDALNEADKGNDNLEGSSPLVVNIESRVNPVDDVFFEWIIYKSIDEDNYRRYNDRDIRLTFTEGGSYWAKLIAKSGYGCEAVDSVKITVLISSIDVPNVFTPNGDGFNDEFRVAYRSLIKYHIIIKNRLGRTVYSSSDPAKGWDGRIGGREAAQGAYYYVITATGSGEEGKAERQYNLSGAVSLLR